MGERPKSSEERRSLLTLGDDHKLPVEETGVLSGLELALNVLDSIREKSRGEDTLSTRDCNGVESGHVIHC